MEQTMIEFTADIASSAVPAADRAPITHALKCWPKFFEAIAEGRKRHDLRRADDRDFRVGDFLKLCEFEPTSEAYTGREQTVQITYLTSSTDPCALSDRALDDDFCILSIALVFNA